MSETKIMPIVKAKTTKEVVYEQLKNAIFIGIIKKDEIITEMILAKSLNTSRTPVREAVGDLLKDGLLVSIPGKGLKIREITSDEKEQIIFLRISIELEGLTKILPVITSEQITDLSNIIDCQKIAVKENNRINFIDLDQKFHREILRIAKLDLLNDILLHIYNLWRLIGHQALSKKGRMDEVIDEHIEIIKALEKKDLSLVLNTMKNHLSKTNEAFSMNQNKDAQN